MDTAIFSLEQVTVFFPNGTTNTTILKDISLTLNKGQHIGLYAPNGSGKTTLLRTITGLHIHKTGRILFHGKEVQNEDDYLPVRQHVGFVLQEASDQIFFPTVLEDVIFGPLNLGLSSEEANERALDTLSALGIDNLAHRLCHQLSGGEKRLVALAGILAMQPEALLLDEPTTGLDAHARERLCSILQKLDTSQIIVSHDPLFLQKVTTAWLTIEEKHLIPANKPISHTHEHAHIGGGSPHVHTPED